MKETLTTVPGSLPLRAGLAREIERAWQRLAAPGTWFRASERIAVAQEVRNARDCPLCIRRKSALSPYAETGPHAHAGALQEPLVEVVHRIASDAGRLKQSWVRQMTGAGISEEQYVEATGVVALITALDVFDRSLGRPQRELPAPQAGEPSRQRPAGAKPGLAWVATVAPQDVAAGEPNPYAVHGEKNIHRALSLVPQEVFNFFDVDVELYLKDHEIRDFATEYRALSHPQIELLAGRVSALNGCYY